MSQQLPPPPPPSPHYASPSTHSDGVKRKYGEKEYEEIYNHFNEYSKTMYHYFFSSSHYLKQNIESYRSDRTAELEIVKAFFNEFGRNHMKKWTCFSVGCGLMTLGMLRLRRTRLGRGAGMSTHTPSTKPPAAGPSSHPRPEYSRPIDSPFRTSGQPKFKYSMMVGKHPLTGWAIDVLSAGIVWAGSYYYVCYHDMFRPKPIITSEGETIGGRWTSPDVPLVPGRSFTSDVLCGPLTEEFRKFPKELWQSGTGHGIQNDKHLALYANLGWKGTKYHPDTNLNVGSRSSEGRGVYEREVLDSLQGFIINCERRARQEEKIRKSLALPENAPVVISSDGVRADEDLELDDIYLDLELDDIYLIDEEESNKQDHEAESEFGS